MKKHLMFLLLVGTMWGQSDTYTVIEAHHSTYDAKGPLENWHPVPARYRIRHGKVVITAECLTIDLYQAQSVACTSLVDPDVQVGVPQSMRRHKDLLYWSVPFDDGVTFRVLSEREEGCQ